ncbi:iron-sulfur cluster assembly accessory protein [uncultured Cohaesibacter sp.]|uniref:iron-sulfur cluster assembly accessory protein n=1 Tax=uncultured Cohaesibacter sp. TaxID=1002546 RepID=UPI0029318A2F|nr:iron-sulfur cluster assembly accessory protein [uncultured Cohaesibacter sp.]
MLTLTPNAKEKLQGLIEKADKPLTGLRIKADMMGCAGIKYRLALVENPEDDDHIVECGDINLYVVPENAEILIGTVIDFEEKESGSGFTFANPNTAGMCACGKSFAA